MAGWSLNSDIVVEEHHGVVSAFLSRKARARLNACPVPPEYLRLDECDCDDYDSENTVGNDDLVVIGQGGFQVYDLATLCRVGSRCTHRIEKRECLSCGALCGSQSQCPVCGHDCACEGDAMFVVARELKRLHGLAASVAGRFPKDQYD